MAEIHWKNWPWATAQEDNGVDRFQWECNPPSWLEDRTYTYAEAALEDGDAWIDSGKPAPLRLSVLRSGDRDAHTSTRKEMGEWILEAFADAINYGLTEHWGYHEEEDHWTGPILKEVDGDLAQIATRIAEAYSASRLWHEDTIALDAKFWEGRRDKNEAAAQPQRGKS